ncbi:hypothetical protein GOBAR_AA18683 [Gossypium barbadense]|uniref:Gnk2-homologous domain-containing protein n=1 Tax=Gossypium barbadense TaxID=3634 RepID=A0A2P5XF90_GOSBA|nr:hypothetical protein GOBAR_AA18683 [Gossypium barbadense]
MTAVLAYPIIYSIILLPPPEPVFEKFSSPKLENVNPINLLANLNVLTDYLSIQAPPSGFGLGSIGQNPNQAYGLALCRGDVSTPDCKTCVVEAGSEIRKRCPYDKGAIIWYDNCLFKYANMEFFGHVDNQNKFYMWNLNNVSEPQLFNAKTKELLSDLATQAYANPKMYAAGEMELYGSNKLYGLTQCAGTFPALSVRNVLTT